MNDFTLILQQSTQTERINDITSFVAEDASGSFAIRAGHTRFMTSLVVGLARFRINQAPWQYLALPGGILFFDHNRLVLNTRHYLRSDDYRQISQALLEQLLAEEESLLSTRKSLHHMEQDVIQRLWALERGESA